MAGSGSEHSAPGSPGEKPALTEAVLSGLASTSAQGSCAVDGQATKRRRTSDSSAVRCAGPLFVPQVTEITLLARTWTCGAMCRGSGGSSEIFEELKRRRSSLGRTPSEAKIVPSLACMMKQPACQAIVALQEGEHTWLQAQREADRKEREALLAAQAAACQQEQQAALAAEQEHAHRQLQAFMQSRHPAAEASHAQEAKLPEASQHLLTEQPAHSGGSIGLADTSGKVAPQHRRSRGRSSSFDAEATTARRLQEQQQQQQQHQGILHQKRHSWDIILEAVDEPTGGGELVQEHDRCSAAVPGRAAGGLTPGEVKACACAGSVHPNL